MEKVIVIYGMPDDPEHFKAHYRETHLPLVKKMPFLIAFSYTFDVQSTGDDIFCIFEATFPDREALEKSMKSEAGLKASADTTNYATGGLSIINFPIEG